MLLCMAQPSAATHPLLSLCEGNCHLPPPAQPEGSLSLGDQAQGRAGILIPGVPKKPGCGTGGGDCAGRALALVIPKALFQIFSNIPNISKYLH